MQARARRDWPEVARGTRADWRSTPCRQDRAVMSMPFWRATLARAWRRSRCRPGRAPASGRRPAPVRPRAGRPRDRSGGDNPGRRRRRPCSRRRRPGLEPAREMAEDEPHEDRQRAEDRRRLDDVGHPGELTRRDPGEARDPAFRDREELGRHRHHPQASQEEEPEERQVPVCHVADLMAEDRGDLDAG